MLVLPKIFGYYHTGLNEGMYSSDWVVAQDLAEYQQTFERVAGSASRISGFQAKTELVRLMTFRAVTRHLVYSIVHIIHPYADSSSEFVSDDL